MRFNPWLPAGRHHSLIKRSAGAASDPILLLLLFDDSKDDELTSEKRNLMINEWWLEGFRVIIGHTINFSLNNLTDACLSQPLSLIRDIIRAIGFI
jgi:hypothetical protein